jgi:hypothetical protein
VYLPYLDGAADERQYRVMTDRERWFRVVMGQDEVARLITSDSGGSFPLPDGISDELSFDLGINGSPSTFRCRNREVGGGHATSSRRSFTDVEHNLISPSLRF